ncbi:hypothetical protein VaNZ11_007289 [Volvox africanus]|uniref:Protease Do-like PDZ domain-containing protein n=1 Tax=Volvox africanus TaxID=51714 RepID=A0ABQ5S3V9_9CHLO|nr:hypothetical protein VaNZ11_007289 [Volvox africanus]
MASSASPSRAYMPNNEQQRHDDVFLTRNSVAIVPTSPTKRPRTESSANMERQLHVNLTSNAGAINGFNHNSKSTAARHLDKALRSVVKIFSTSANPSFNLPWQIMSQSKSTASGFVVAPLSSRRILTNAHAVANQVQVMLRKHGNARKYPARVLAVGHECDIAMLTVDDNEFWEEDGGVEALEVGGLPPMQESVTVVGFPQGGDNVCVTKGVASRLDRQQYSHGRCALLTVQTDAPINSGNSGGPVLQGDQVVGLAFQSLVGAENTGYVIPTPVVHHFLTDLDRHGGKYTGFPQMGISWQCLESDDMKRALGMPKGATGIYITSTEPMFDSSKILRAGDVLTSVDGHRIADDGTYMFPDMSVRIDFRHLSSMAYDGDGIKISIWRDGAALELTLRVRVPQHLVPIHSHDQKPKYYIFAGLVFTRLTNIYLRHHYGVEWATRAPIKLCDRSFCGSMEVPGQEVVLLSKVLSANVNQGFQEMQNYQVYKVNGVKVHNLAHLARLVEQCDSEYIRFDLDWKKVIVLHTDRGRAATPDILSMNCIPAAASKGLLEEVPQLPADLTLLCQPSMAENEVVGDEEAVAVEDRIARLAMLANQLGSGDRNSTWSEVSKTNEDFRA